MNSRIHVFDHLYKVLRAEYWEGPPERHIFGEVARSMVLRDAENFGGYEFPWLFLNWGRSSPMGSERSGEFTYEFVVPVVVVAFAEGFEQVNLNVNPDAPRNADGRLIVDEAHPLGVGDLESDVIDFMVDHYKPEFMPPTPEFSVVDWWIGDTEPPRQPALQLLQVSPFIRMSQIDFTFTVVEPVFR